MGARVARRAPGHRLEVAGRPARRRRSTSTKRRSRAPRRRCWRPPRRRACPRSVTPPASRTSSSCASSCAAWASASAARARTRSGSKASPRCSGATKTLYGDYIEAGSWAVVGAITGGADRSRRHAAGGHGSRRVGAQEDARAVRAGRRRVPRRAVEAGRRRPHHDGTVAGLSERPRQPGDRAGDAGRRRHAGARLDVRTAAVRAGADERHGRATCSSAIRTASSSPARAGCAASRSTAATSARAWR